MGVNMKWISLLSLVLAGAVAQAAIPGKQTLFVQTLDGKKNRYMSEGVFTGGKAGTGATVLGVRRTFSAKAQIERLIIDMGDKDGKPDKNALSYFQASMDPSTNRLVLDLTQLRTTRITEQKLKDVIRSSAFVRDAEFTLDPEDKTGSMVFHMKRPMKMEVFQLHAKGKPSRVVIDLKPVAVKR